MLFLCKVSEILCVFDLVCLSVQREDHTSSAAWRIMIQTIFALTEWLKVVVGGKSAVEGPYTTQKEGTSEKEIDLPNK